MSSLQKAIRRSHTDDAAYWVMELADSFPAYAWRRLRTILSEDVGLAAPPGLVADFEALYRLWQDARAERKGDDGKLQLLHATLLLARSPKSRLVNNCLLVHGIAADTYRDPPDYALDMHTKRGREMGRGLEHFWNEAALLADPESGELTAEGSMSDVYLARARAALEGDR